MPLRSEREKFAEYESKMKRSKTVGDEIDVRIMADEYKRQGNEHYKQKDYAKALELYTSAIKQFGGDAAYHANAAVCLLRLERYEECIAAAQNALKLDPTHAKSLFRISQAYEVLGEDALALQYMTKAVQSDASCRTDMERLKKKVSTFNLEGIYLNLVIFKPLFERVLIAVFYGT